MKNKIQFAELSIGFVGQLILMLMGFIIFNLGLNVHWSIFFLILLPLSFMTAMDQTTIDIKNRQYRSGTVYLFFISFNKWFDLTQDCFLKIEPITKTTSFDSGRIDHGSMSKTETALYLKNVKFKHKCYLEQGKYNNIILRANNYSKQLDIRVIDYKTLRKK